MKNTYTLLLLFICMAFSSHAVTITGTVNNYTDDTGKLNVILYTQANYAAYNFLTYEDLFQQASPEYPVDYTLNVTTAGTYAVVVYLDTNGNGTIDLGEPVDAIENLTVDTENIAGQNFTFGDTPVYAISGQISYAGSIAGDVYTYVFKQSDFLAQNLSSPVGILKSASPTYPIDYMIEVPGPDTYVVFTFIDENGSGAYTVNETVAYEMNVVISDANKTATVDLVLPDVEKISVGGTITYDGTTIGNLYIAAFNQSEFEVGDFSNPLNIAEVEDPAYPYAYEITCPDKSECALMAFIDYNGNKNYDVDEPYDTLQHITVDGVAVTGADMLLEEMVVITATFKLDKLTSTWDNGVESGTFHAVGLGGYSPGTKNGRTAMTMDSFEEDTLMFGFGFWIDETDSGELDSSYWEAGTKMHIEYTFPDTLDINFIAVGSLVDGVKISEGRLAIDIEVVDPVRSASGDFNACCGMTISCDPKHSGGIDCYGAVYYGDLYVQDMGFAVSQTTDKVGLRINGYDGEEGHLTAILPDSFLVNVLKFSGEALPESSEVLDGFIPDLIKSQDYTVTNDYAPITSGFDVDADGTDNTMYKVTINNSSWSPHDLLFGAAETTNVISESENKSLVILFDNRITLTQEVDKLELFDITGKIVWSKQSLAMGEMISVENLNSGIYILSVNGLYSYKFVSR